MGWIIYFISVTLLAVILTKFKNVRNLWPMGLLTILFLYIIDSGLVSLGAYSFSYGNPFLGDLPIFYLLAGFPGGFLIAYFFPAKKQFQFPYILLTAALFIWLELIMKWFEYIHYINWNIFRSSILNVGSFMSILWLGQWLNATGKGSDQAVCHNIPIYYRKR